MLIVRRRIAGLGREMAGPIHELAPMRYEHPASARRDDLVTVEGERGTLAKAAGRPTLARGAQRLRRILYDRHVMPAAHLGNSGVIRTLPVQVDGHDGGDAAAFAPTPQF